MTVPSVSQSAIRLPALPLDGKHAVVTGGGRGIGAAVTRALLAHGAWVTIVARDRARLDTAVRVLGPAGPLHAEHGDVTDPDTLARALDGARARFGPIHILINNAGQAGSAGIRRMDLALWRRMIAVNLDGTFYAVRAVVAEMVSAGWGRIVNVASTAGLVGYPYASAYCAAKHGVVGLTRALAAELATTGVTVNAICPAFTETAMFADAVATIVAKTGRTPAEATADILATTPQRRLVRPEEVANAVARCCLPGSDALTGQAIAVAGDDT